MAAQHTSEIISPGIIKITFHSISTNDDLAALKEWDKEEKKLVHKTFKETGEKVKILVNLSQFKQYRGEMVSILDKRVEEDEAYISKIATYGASTMLIRVGQDLLKNIISFPVPFKSFKTEKEAIKWLQLK